MRIDLSKILQRVLRLLHLTPLSLAEKCRIMFGAAVLLSLVIALLIPYIWMRQLSRKVLLDTHKAKAEATLLQSHFQLKPGGQVARRELNAQGAARDPNEPGVLWIRFHKEQDKTDFSPLSDEQRRILTKLGVAGARDEQIALSRVDGSLESNYVGLFRATEGCVSCHNPQGVAGPFSLNEILGAAVVQRRGIASEWGWMIFMNRIWIVMAGLIGGTGAIVAFYWITQRVILRPIRQLRALANNVAEGNLDVRSSIVTGDEYEKLAEAFNHMLDHLQAAQEELYQANRQLDAKIAELSERNIELFKANKLKSEFLANMSHEFRTPLNAILGFAQVLRDKPGLLKRDKGQRYAENIITSGNRLLTMINDLLDLAKTQAGKLELHIEQTSLSQICESLVSSFSLLTQKKRLKVHVEVAADVPVVVTDAGKVQQVLYNFLSNAVKFTAMRGRIDIRASMLDDQMVRIAVEDTGCGIAEADKEKVFDKFIVLSGESGDDGSPAGGRAAQILQTPESPRDARGLGLAICKELAGMLGGSIGLDSELGKGSTFWLDIPVVLAVAGRDSGSGSRPADRQATRIQRTPDSEVPM
jgi:two-component system sensor histidine kinase BarA